MTQARVAAAALALAAALGTASSARADLADDVEALRTALGAAGATTVVVLPPRLLSSRDTLALALPGAASAGVGDAASRCTTVAVLGALSAVFATRMPTRGHEGSDVRPSVGGAVMVGRCGAERRELSDLALEMRSPHAVVEIVVARSAAPLPELRMLLPRRDEGFVPPPSRPPGPAPHPGLLATRAAAFEDGLAESGATDVSRRVLLADDSGAGRLVLDLAPGCHRIAVLAHDAEDPAAPAPDIDAELAWVSGDLAATDRTDGPDATLDVCTASRDLAIVAFAGAAPHGSVLLVRGRSDLPRGLPKEWGDRATARLAKALLDRHVKLSSAPIFTSLGVAGLTVLPIEVEPGQCYLAAIAVVDGSASVVSLNATASEMRSSSHTEDPSGAAVVAFCAGSGSRGVLESEVHGTSLVSALGLWPMGHRRLGEDSP